MFGLSEDDWRDLLLSVNVHRKERRLSPIQVAAHLGRALQQTDIDTLAEALGFTDTTTLRKLLSLNDLPSDVASLVDWGNRRGNVSMSTAAEILRLPTETLIRAAACAAAQHGLTRDEARQVVQIHQRSGAGIDECVRQALATRPRIERSELIIGSLLSQEARAAAARLGNEAAARRLRGLLAREFPEVVSQSVRINGDRFSLLLREEHAGKLRLRIGDTTVESVVTALLSRPDTR